MPKAQSFYEPLIQEQQQATPIRGFQVTIGGTYVLLDDVITCLREYAQSLPDPAAGGLIHEVATWLQSGDRPLPEPALATAGQVVGDAFSEGFHQQIVDPTAQLLLEQTDRVEIYPDDPTAPKPKWVARACSAEGDILFVTNGSFDQEYVIRDAEQRWPDRTIHLVAHAGVDTVWEERDPGGIRSASSGDRRPSPKRLWA